MFSEWELPLLHCIFSVFPSSPILSHTKLRPPHFGGAPMITSQANFADLRFFCRCEPQNFRSRYTKILSKSNIFKIFLLVGPKPQSENRDTCRQLMNWGKKRQTPFRIFLSGSMDYNRIKNVFTKKRLNLTFYQKFETEKVSGGKLPKI